MIARRLRPGSANRTINLSSGPVIRWSQRVDATLRSNPAALKTKAKSLAKVRSAGTLPWLGFDLVPAKKVGSPGEVLSDQLIRWCCIGRPSHGRT